jgi:hypothetical protein
MAIEYLLMPEQIKKLEGQLAALNCDLERISNGLEKLTTVFGKLCEGQVEPDTSTITSLGGKGYVA